MIDASIRGDRYVINRFRQAPPAVRDAIRESTSRLVLRLQRKVMMEKLSGQVLKVRTGTLRRSIPNGSAVVETDQGIAGYVGTRLKYGKLHELGGVIPAHPIEAIKGKSLRFQLRDGKAMFRRRVMIPTQQVPPRSFLGSALEEMHETIIKALDKAAKAAIRRG